MFNMKKLVVLLLCAGLVFQAHFGIAGPQGGKVVGGNANISQSGPNTTINQTSDRAIINWNSFDIGKNESVRHNMPSSNSAGLHRVVGKGGPSNIEGLLQSNGNVYLVNPAGVVIHNGAKIDVNGFVATTRDIANDNFMKGKMVFDKPGMPGAAIINQGNITLKDNGLAALVAPTVRNDGIIAGKLGKVALGGSEAAWKLDMTGDDLIAFTMDENAVNTLHAADGTPLANVQNNGKIKAEGGVVVLTASQLDGIVGSVVNNGEISAASAETKGGKIIFRGQGNKVDVVNNGQLDVSSKSADGGMVRMTGRAAVTHAGKIDATGKTKGGNVVITGENVTLKSGSRIDASGTNGGGTVLVGGNARGKGPEANAKTTLVQSDAEILADAKLNGDGGQIVVWADEKTQFDGKATARGGENGGDGGMVETSAKLLIIGDPAVVNTNAKEGSAGTWLLDPDEFVIAPSGGSMTGKQVSDSLEIGNITLEVGEGEGSGDIIVNDKIEWNSKTTLSLNAYRNITVNKDIIINGDESGLAINSKGGIFEISNSHILFAGNKQTLTINNEPYKLINNFEDLQLLNSDLKGNYALAKNIDGNNALFTPIGLRVSNEEYYDGNYFEGKLSGLGNYITNITIKNNYKNNFGILDIGLISCNNGEISNLNLNNITIDINEPDLVYIGAIAGTNRHGNIFNTHTSSNIKINNGYVILGGLVGANISKSKIEKSSSISNIKLINDSTYEIGGLVGINFSGVIDQCFSKADINIQQLHNDSLYYHGMVGGFVGNNETDWWPGYSKYFEAKINNSYAIATISINYNDNISTDFNTMAGGFAGGNSGNILNSYCSTDIQYTNQKEIDMIGAFVGQAYSSTPYYWGYDILGCYWDTDTSTVKKGIGGYREEDGLPPAYLENFSGLTSEAMRQKASFKDWDFENVWKIDEGKSYPELRYVANNDLIIPDKPIDPTPPVDPDPKPDPDPNPEGPDNPDPKPDNPVTPDKPVNPDPDPDTPAKPERPSNPGNNPGGTPSQPSTKPDTKPDNPGTNQPEKPVVPEQPSKPVQPDKPVTPEQPSDPETNPGGNTPSQPSTKPETKPETPVIPNQPSNPGGSSSGDNNTGIIQIPVGSTITYKVIDGNVHVFRDNQHLGILAMV